MTLKQRITAFVQIKQFILRHYSAETRPDEVSLHQGLNQLVELARQYNGWFTPNYVNKAIQNIGILLDEAALVKFSAKIQDTDTKTVAIICAGNIPLVCFHDVLCVLLSGHRALIKMSADDNILLPFFLKLLCHYAPEFEKQILFAEGKLSGFDAVIATGSNNTAVHFEFYFGKYPNLIRKNRTSIAVLSGKERKDELMALGNDIFDYFGLGCRNVNKILVPRGYSFNSFFESIIGFADVVNNNKYGNNYDYNRAIYLLESIPFLDNNFVMLRESTELHSPIGILYYEFYDSEAEVKANLEKNKDQLQCIVGAGALPFGCSQQPVITDFADNVNTLEFLLNL